MAGYATGEVFFASQALGLRHSHLDAGGYAYDQKATAKDAAAAADFLLADEAGRCLLTSMVACLFARGVYSEELLAECLASVGYGGLARGLAAAARTIQRERWRLRLSAGFAPEQVPIPERFHQITTWKGPIDPDYLAALRAETARRIRALGQSATGEA
jgi:aldehyde:ferredoxin oxidoreductase